MMSAFGGMCEESLLVWNVVSRTTCDSVDPVGSMAAKGPQCNLEHKTLEEARFYVYVLSQKRTSVEESKELYGECF